MKYQYCTWILAVAIPLANAAEPDKTILPDQFKVYYNQKVGLSTKSFDGAQEKVVPTNNEYKDAPGCYVACYSKNEKDSAYYIMDNVYMMGQVRVPGTYTSGYCLPKGFENKELSSAQEFKEKCATAFPTQCQNNSCWADGHTANFFTE